MFISFLSQTYAEKLLPKSNMAMISISEPCEEVNLKDGWMYLLSLKFHDIGGCGKIFI